MLISKKTIIIVLLLTVPLCTAIADEHRVDTEAVNPLENKNIAILIGPQYGLPMLEAIIPPMVHTFVKHGISLNNIYVEFLDIHRSPNTDYQEHVLDGFVRKLSGKHIDLFIAVNQGAVDFLANKGQDLFPEAPMIIPIFEQDPVWEGPPRQVIKLLSHLDAAGTLAQALTLFPRTEQAVIIMGKDDESAPFLEPVRSAIEHLELTIPVTTTASMTHEEMLRYISDLPRNTIAFYGSYFSDITGRSFIPAEVAAQVAKTADAPVFAFRDMHIYQGLTGGSVTVTTDLGVQAAEVGIEYLAGSLSSEQQMMSVTVENVPLYNWEQVRKWGGNPRDLPDNTLFFNRPPSIMEEHRTTVIVAGIMFVILIMLVIALIILNSRQRSAITGRKQAEELFRLAFENSNQGMCLTDPQGNIQRANRWLVNAFGYQKEELERMTIFDITHPDYIHLSRNFIDEAAAKHADHTEFEKVFIHQDGHHLWVLNSSSAIRDTEGNLLYFIIHIKDITERKQFEKSLKKSEADLREAQDIARIERWELDLVNNTLIWSDGIYSLLELEETDAELSYEKVLQYVHPEDREKVIQAYQESVEEGKPYKIIHRMLMSEDRIKWLSARARTDYDESGTPVRTVGTLQDITDQLLAEEERDSLQEQLYQSQKMEAVGKLAGGVAHDYNNMLSVIMGYTEMALEKTDPEDPLNKDLIEVMNASKRSADITRQLLTFARKQSIAPAALNLNTAIPDMQGMIRRLIGESIDLQWRPGNELWNIIIDPAQVDQILVNLCINARDAIEDVGNITIETSNIIFDEDYCNTHAGFIQGEFVMLAVSDTGSGMDKAVLASIFEPFFTTKAVGHGSGLGLPTVYGIVKQNNGFINVYSEPGSGSTFKVCLPRYIGEGETAETASIDEVSVSQGETILLVEDESTILNLGTRMLEEFGYHVIGANSPEEAVNLVKDMDCDLHLLITDVVMPGMNGKELMETLSKMCPNIKVVYMSGYTANVIVHHGVFDPGIHFLQKPFSKRGLAEIVRKALQE